MAVDPFVQAFLKNSKRGADDYSGGNGGYSSGGTKSAGGDAFTSAFISNSAARRKKLEEEQASQATQLKEQAKQPTTTKINVGGKDIEIDEQTKKSWFSLNEEAKRVLKERLGEETFNQLKSTLDKEAPKQGIFDKITDVVSANSEMDKFKRTQQGQAEDYRTAQREAGEKDYTNPFQRVAFTVAEPVARGVNTVAGAVGKGVQGVSDVAGYVAAGTPEEKRIALERMKRSEEDIAFSGRGGLLGVGANFQNASELENKRKLAGTAVQTGADIASILPTGSAAKTGATVAGNAVKRRLGEEVATNVIAGLASEGGRQLKEGKFDPKSLAVGAAMDTAIPLGAFGAGRLVSPIFSRGAEEALNNLNNVKAQKILDLGREANIETRSSQPLQLGPGKMGNTSVTDIPIARAMSDVEYTKQFNKLSRQYDELTKEIESGGPLSQKVKIEDLDAYFSQQLETLDNEFLNPTTTQTIQTGFTRPTEPPVQPKAPLSPTAKRIAQIDKINASVQKNGLGSYTPEQLRGLMRERKELVDGTKFKSDVSSSVDSALSDAPITNTPKTMVQLTGDNAFRKFESKIVPAIKHIIKGSDSTARGKMFNRFAEQMSDDLVAINSVAKYMEETGRAPRGSYDAMIGMERKAVRSAADTQRWIEADSGWNRSKKAIYDNAKEGETLSSLRTKYDEYTKAYSELQIHDLYEKTGGKVGRTHTPEELADLQSKVAEFDSPGAREYAQGIVELYRNWLKSQLDEGEITPETYKTLSEQPYDYIKQQYEFTPEERAAFAGKQPSNKPGRILKRQKETVQREMLSPAETMMATIQKGMTARAENNLKNQFVDIMLTAGDTGIRRVEKASPTKNHFTTVRNGKEVIWEAPAEITKAFDNLKPNQLGAMMNAARAINNVTKFGITSGNIGFSLLKNPPMDLARSLINSETPLAMLNPLNIASSVYNASGLSKRVLSDLQQKMYEDFMSRLGTESTRIQQYGKSPSASKVVMESVKQDAGWKKRGVNVAKNPKEFGKAITGTLKGVEKQLAKTEIATRFLNYQTAYKKAIKRGFSEVDAIDKGMEAAIGNTTEFLAGGVFSKNANAWVKYFNAPIQGSRAFARAFEKRPITTTAKMFTTVGLPMMLLTANNTETPEKLAIYNEISDIDKENYHIYISDGATYDPETKKFTGVQFVRKPNDISAWFSGVQKSIERLANDEPAEHGKLLQFFTDTASSVRDNAPLPTTQKGLVGAVAGPATPIVEDVTNKSIFYGNDLVPEALRTSSETPEEQRFKNYSRTSKFLGGLLGKSPLVIDNYIRGYGGEVGTNIQNLIDRATGGRTDLVNEKGETYSDIGGKSFGETLSKAAGGRSGGETSRQFWEQIGGKESPAQRAKNKASKKVTDAVNAGDYVRAARLAREYNETVAGRVTPFLKKYQNSPSWDPDWDEYINKLFISDKLPALKRRGND